MITYIETYLLSVGKNHLRKKESKEGRKCMLPGTRERAKGNVTRPVGYCRSELLRATKGNVDAIQQHGVSESRQEEAT